MVVKTLGELAALLQGSLNNPEYASRTINVVTGLDAASQHILSQALTFAEKESSLKEAEALGFSAVVIPEGLDTEIPAIKVKNARIAFAVLLGLFYPIHLHEPGIHPSAHVSDSAQIAATAYIGPFAIVGDNAIIADNCQIMAHASVGSDSSIGAHTRLMPGVSVGEHVTLGSKSLVGPLTIIEDDSTLGDDIEIGARCFIGNHVLIQDGVRIDNLACIEEGAKIAPLAIVISQNCLQPDVNLGKLSITAGQCLVEKGRQVGDFVTVAARSRVDKDIPAGQAIWSGDPVDAHKTSMRQIAMRQLPLNHWKELQQLAKLSPKD